MNISNSTFIIETCILLVFINPVYHDARSTKCEKKKMHEGTEKKLQENLNRTVFGLKIETGTHSVYNREALPL